MKWKKLVLVALAATMAIGAAGCGSQQKADSGKGAAVSGSDKVKYISQIQFHKK